ncbi:histidinol-phosphate transaminase [Streptomyces iranensis]|uniref:Histidinol-phosphate aminotransferase n=1 Tax=Streptomyces iranensis TaxID=576784 RepID=A0A060ZKM8_9ACTN|nr:histidinol-phosphate transaminase [Streptomyces iranensis]MBP2060853.1 histidinol-phosphate aminotransferase [Streptomyces iranensis]CDR06314.1 Histidinol-phosphate aminotransferase [Streptomyces iranensis]
MTGPEPRLRAVLNTLSSRPRAMTDSIYRAHANECPYPPVRAVIESVNEAGAAMNRYPDDRCSELVRAIAEDLLVPTAHVAVGPGSTAIVQQLLLATVEHGDEVVFSWPSFERYPTLSAVAGARPVSVPLRGPDQDLRGLAEAVTARTRLIFIGNPNDPTGTSVDRRDLDVFLERVPSDVLVILDEEYQESTDAPSGPDGVRLHLERPNVAVVRSFSHANGLAGLRVGFAIARPAVARAVRRTGLPYAVDVMAQAAALASLRAKAEVSERVLALRRERDRVAGFLRARGWRIPAAGGNFLWLPLGDRSAEFRRACADLGVAVHEVHRTGVRVTIREVEANNLVLFVASRFSAA